jgi:hypothetical protein
MDCVFDAYTEHLEFLGLRTGAIDWQAFRAYRRLLQGRDEATKGYTAPYIINKLARRKNLVTITQTGCGITGGHWIEAAPGLLAKRAARNTEWWASDEVWIEPAIYLMWGASHAIFSATLPPVGRPVVAIRIFKPEDKND